MTTFQTWILILIMMASPSFAKDDAEFLSLLKNDVHQKVEDIRKNKKELEDYIMETHVRKAQVDFYMQFRQKGLSAQEIQDIFSSDAYQKLFDRIRTNPSLRKRTQAYLTKLLAPYYLEDRVIAKHIELSQKFHELVSEEYEAQVLAYQRKIRQIKTPPPEKLGFWAKMTKKIKEHFLGT